jgi:hypothetical protein
MNEITTLFGLLRINVRLSINLHVSRTVWSSVDVFGGGEGPILAVYDSYAFVRSELKDERF